MDVRSVSPGDYGSLRLVSGLVSGTGGATTVDLAALDVGDVVIASWAQVLVAFNGTTPQLTLGNGVTANKFLADADVTEGTPGVYPATVKQAATAETVAGTLRATLTGSGISAGSARVYCLVTKAPA